MQFDGIGGVEIEQPTVFVYPDPHHPDMYGWEFGLPGIGLVAESGRDFAFDTPDKAKMAFDQVRAALQDSNHIVAVIDLQ